MTERHKEDYLDRKVKLRDVIEVLSNGELGYMKGCEFIAPIKPHHGSCCCCFACGQYHDDCVCQHNELLKALLEIRGCIDETPIKPT